jgi:NTP pyrophosphatase (non-canonical NTP hydrolase)
VDLTELQQSIRDTYGARDAERGLLRTHAWFVEECGELSRALFRQDRERQVEEIADVLAWLTTLADMAGIQMSEAADRYAAGCPKCSAKPCVC